MAEKQLEEEKIQYTLLNFTFHLSAGGKVEASLSEELGEVVEEVAIVWAEGFMEHSNGLWTCMLKIGQKMWTIDKVECM